MAAIMSRGDELTAIYQESAVYGNETEVKLAHKKCQQSSVFHIHLHIFVYTQEWFIWSFPDL